TRSPPRRRWWSWPSPGSFARSTTGSTTFSPSTYGDRMRRSPGISVEEAPELDVQRMRRRHLRGVMVIERQVYPRPWSPNLFLSEMSDLRNWTYLVARIGKEVAGYGGVMAYGDEDHLR